MYRKEFINRKEELAFLDSIYDRNGFEFLVVSGRRRTGKSRLLKEFVNRKNREYLFLLCEDRKWQVNLAKFNSMISEYFNIPNADFKTFADCFKYILTQKKERIIIVIDEFSYLIKKTDIVAEFQTIVDEILVDSNIMLVLSGSAVSMMNKKVLGYKSPLYGRTTGNIFLQPMKFRNLSEWFNFASTEELIKIYSVCDGIPKYLEFFYGQNIEKEILENVFNPNSFLFREPKLLLEEELREPETYLQILEAISLGHTKVVEIANYSYMEAKDISAYLLILMDIGFIEKEYSVLDKKRARGIYKMKDNFFSFWFRFISRHYGKIEVNEPEEGIHNFKKNFNQHLGFTFEKVSGEFLVENTGKLPFRFTKTGRWWHKDKEIDIVAVNDETKQILFMECKWKNLMGKQAIKILGDLKEKSKYVDWNTNKEKEYFGLIAKKIENKAELRKEGFIIFDLDDF